MWGPLITNEEASPVFEESPSLELLTPQTMEISIQGKSNVPLVQSTVKLLHSWYLISQAITSPSPMPIAKSGMFKGMILFIVIT